MAHQRFSLFPDSPHMRQVFSPRSIRARWSNNDPVVTVAIMLVCIALWIVELLLGFLAPQLLNGLLQFGMFQPASAFREPWTFITSMFLHEPRSIFHILFNMLTLWAVGPFLERLMGHWAYLVLYAVSGIGGGMGMMVWAALSGNQFNWLTASYGASGALFGLFAACLVVYRKVGEDLRSMLIWMGINFLMPLITPNIAWQAHLGGFVVGGLLTLLTIDGVPALRRTSTLVRIGIYGGVFVVIMAVVFAFCNAGNPALQPMVWTANLG